MNIKKFIINNADKSLTINFIKGKAGCLSFEYLRVFTPTMASSPKQKTLVTHKKIVMLSAIESVGKHGFRLIFDDQHSAIYSSEYLALLIKEYEPRWQHYLTELQASGHSRETMINITQL
ncbi:MAG: hypothetical protein COB83_06855 [Gammaproteobacteria bacterium]|nr:MAG: hypothetical protein COB83_06855 [Gammaproteobacteria bacterium]